MGIFDGQDTHDELKKILERERKAILEGRFEGLEELTNEKQSLLNALSRSKLDNETLAQFKEQSERNALLLDAARSGIGSALERIKAINEPIKRLRTYDQSGRQREINTGQTNTSRRA